MKDEGTALGEEGRAQTLASSLEEEVLLCLQWGEQGQERLRGTGEAGRHQTTHGLPDHGEGVIPILKTSGKHYVNIYPPLKWGSFWNFVEISLGIRITLGIHLTHFRTVMRPQQMLNV